MKPKYGRLEKRPLGAYNTWTLITQKDMYGSTDRLTLKGSTLLEVLEELDGKGWEYMGKLDGENLYFTRKSVAIDIQPAASGFISAIKRMKPIPPAMRTSK